MNPVTELAIKNIHPKWKVLLNSPTRSTKTLIEILDDTLGKTGAKLCPDHPDKILRCLQLDPDLIKVVILGQDLYPQPGIATGLAFGVNYGAKWQPSLEMLVRELFLEYPNPEEAEIFDSTLTQWESQGVLLLNSSLSCEQFKPGSHSKLWEEFIEGLLGILNDFKITRKEMTSIVFVFLGRQAQLFEAEISNKLHYKIMRFHPVAETHASNKFKGFFKEVNQHLEESGQEQINWI